MIDPVQEEPQPPPAAPRFSLVIPAWNEEKYLPRLLDSVDVARRRYSAEPNDIEVIAADNDSADATAQIAAERGCRVARVKRRCIAASRNGGAAVARGEILCFIDADSRIHPDTFIAGDEAMRSGRYVCAATGIRTERMSLGIAMTFVMLLPLLWLTRSDGGVLFCRREDFQKVGGYDDSMLASEDLRFVWALNQLGRKRRPRQGFKRLRAAKAIASTRKFDTRGDWHFIPLLLKGAWLMLRRSHKFEDYAKAYWYEDER